MDTLVRKESFDHLSEDEFIGASTLFLTGDILGLGAKPARQDDLGANFLKKSSPKPPFKNFHKAALTLAGTPFSAKKSFPDLSKKASRRRN